MRFIQYSRKSSEGDERQVQSIPDQESVLDRLAKQQGLRVIAKLSEARSAKTPNGRPVFQQVLQMIEQGQADGILCWHLNRLSRNPVDSGQLAWMLQTGRLQSIKTPERTYLPEDNVVIMAVENAVANQYILDLKRNIRRAQDEKAARGWWPMRPPPGYRTDAETREIVVDPEPYALMHRAFELLQTGGYTIGEVWQQVNRWGYQDKFRYRKQTRPMGKSRFYRLVSNPFYYGAFCYRGEMMLGRHQPMITKAEFDRIQAIVKHGGQKRPQKHHFAFTGLIRCGVCGCLITAERKVKHYRSTNRRVAYVYYHCTGRKGCPYHSVTESFVQQEIVAALEKCHVPAPLAQWANAVIKRDWGLEPDWLTKLLDQQRKSLRVREQQVERLLDLRLSGEIEPDEYQQRKNRLREEIVSTELAIKRLQDKTHGDLISAANAVRFGAFAPELFATATPAVKRELARALATGYVLTLEKLDIQVHPILAKISEIEPPKMPQKQIWELAGMSPVPTRCPE